EAVGQVHDVRKGRLGHIAQVCNLFGDDGGRRVGLADSPVDCGAELAGAAGKVAFHFGEVLSGRGDNILQIGIGRLDLGENFGDIGFQTAPGLREEGRGVFAALVDAGDDLVTGLDQRAGGIQTRVGEGIRDIAALDRDGFQNG
ncbi:unnamed protein product, partial [Ectocarpus fasciculatus]